MFNHALIPDWKQAWRWASVRLMALGAAWQFALVSVPPQIRHELPDWLVQYGAMICFGAALYGRVTHTEIGKGDDHAV